MIANATSYRAHRHYSDRVRLTDRTDGGKQVAVIARYIASRHLVRPIAGSEEKMTECALAGERPSVDRGQLARSVAALSRDLAELRRAAG